MHTLKRNLTILSVLGVAWAPRAAQADLTGMFAQSLEVDTSYVTGANGATDIAFHADGRALVTRKTGQITVRLTDGTTAVLNAPFMGVDTASEKGLLGVVADPNVALNDTFYFYVSNGSSNDDKHRVYKGVLGDDNQLTIDMTTPVIAASRMLGPGLEGPANHDGGGLFIHENQLYVGVGDTGSNATPPQNKYGSCLNKGNGKILRVNLDGTIPEDNPLVGVASVTSCDSVRGDWGTAAPDERIFAWGFRNPWRFWIDPHTDLMWIGDVGETTREEISVGTGNQHYGYPFVEGTTEYDPISGKSCSSGISPEAPCTGPVHDYDSGMTVGNSVTGGLIPEGCGWTNAFQDRLLYLFADWGSGFIKALEVKPDRTGVTSATAIDVGSYNTAGPVSFRMGPDEALYIVMNKSGGVYRVAPSDPTGADCMSGGTGGAGGMGGSAGSAGSATAGTNNGTGGTVAGTGNASGGSSAGSATTGGTGGSVTTGGTGATGGTGGSTGGTTGGSVATGGTSPGTGGSGTAGSATAGSSTGTAGQPGAGGGGDAGDDGGCGCRVAGQRNGALAAMLAGLALVFGVMRRRKRR